MQSGTEGQRIRIEGRVLDGNGEPIPDAMIEVWQANAHGRYNHPADDRRDNLLDPDFKGFGRTGTGVDPKAASSSIRSSLVRSATARGRTSA